MKTLSRIAILALLVGACVGVPATPAPMPTPQIVKVEVPVPGPPVIIERTPVACLQALAINEQAWIANAQFLNWLVNDIGSWTQGDVDAFKDLWDAFVVAQEACIQSGITETGGA